jgi:hypothetical protein
VVVPAPVLFWLEKGLAQVEAFPAVDYGGEFYLRQFQALLPPVTELARLWGRLDPQRAAGALSAVYNPLLRSAGHAAALEFATWPVSAIAPALRRAERENLTAAVRRRLDELAQLDLWDQLAVAWARHWPEALPGVYARLHARLRPGNYSALWTEVILARARARSPWPDPGSQPPGGPPQWRRAATWGLTPGARLRACLALAVHAVDEPLRRSLGAPRRG